MSSFTKQSEFPILVGDVGGTNVRFAMVGHPHRPPEQIREFKCAAFPGLVAAAECYLDGIQQRCPSRLGIAVATPVSGDRVDLTNSSWSFSISQARRQLGAQQLLVINDFQAQALALPYLDASERRQVGAGQAVPGKPLAVLGPGTGLGVSGLIPCNGSWVALSGEGGHTTLAPFDDKEAAVLNLLRNEYAHVSAERLLSGMGMVNLYRAVATLHGCPPQTLTPAEINQRGRGGSCEICAQTLDLFCAMLGTVAADLVLTLGATGGVYLAGGIIPKLDGYFAESRFRARFQDKGRFSDYLARVPSYVITARNPALTGVASLLAAAPTTIGK